MALHLGLTRSQLDELPYEEIQDWVAYFKVRPFGWREDSRAAVIAMALGGSKLKPEDLFSSLRQLKDAQIEKQSHITIAEKFMSRFKGRMTEEWGSSD